ncbi:MAG: c-type cytochrome [Sphingobacteriaceae bacterium]|nr:c-type cytochrome [Sphingobacteriaceae bacterium]
MRNISLLLKNIFKPVAAVAVLTIMFMSSANAQDAVEGRKIFKDKCSSCHALDRKMTGPALKDVDQRHDEKWLISWIKNSSAMVKAGDPAALKIFNEYNQVSMTAFPTLTDADIKNILTYIKEGEPKPKETAETAKVDEGVSTFSIVGVVFIILAAILVLIFLNKAIKFLEKVILKKQGVEIEEEVKTPFMKLLRGMLKNKKFVFSVVLSLVIILVTFGWMGMWETGVHTGYQPVQPIKFSHELHAGINKIECQYCHSGAFKSKNASIPSLNVCMNCHKQVQARDLYAGQISPEIQKIYDALGYDESTQSYDKAKQKPVEWVRIHNLPDLAYFNHSQHVVVGEQAIRKEKGLKPNEPVCFACHGPVDTMVEMYQYSPLTMKWCINCHRNAEVSTKGNAFYDKVIAAHEKIKKGEKITPALLGGLECGKCHY